MSCPWFCCARKLNVHHKLCEKRKQALLYARCIVSDLNTNKLETDWAVKFSELRWMECSIYP